MRVLMVTGMYPNSACATNGVAIARQRKWLESMGLDIDLLHCRPEGKRKTFSTLRALRHLVHSGRYDLIHVHYGLTATLLGLCQPLPLVVTYHGTDINGYPFTGLRDFSRSMMYSTAALVTRQLTRWADAVIVMTSKMKKRLPRRVQAKSWVEPMGVDTITFQQVPREKARVALGWGPEPVVLFCDTNGESVKRRDLADAAVSEALRECASLRLFVMRNVDPDQVPFLLSAADCLLVTSDREGSPNIVRESLACNLPIVSVPVGDVPDLIGQDPLSGRIVPRDSALLGRAIVEIISKPRPTNLARLVNHFSAEESAARVAAIYRLVLKTRHRRYGLLNQIS